MTGEEAQRGGQDGPGDSFVEEELPPNFWGESAGPESELNQAAGARQGSRESSEQGRASKVGAEGLSARSGEVFGSPAGGDAAAGGRGTSGGDGSSPSRDPSQASVDPAFAALQRLFPGKVIEVESSEEAGGAVKGGEESGDASEYPEETP